MEIRFLDRLRPFGAPAPMPGFRGPAQVRAYWEGLRTRSALPARAALDPRGLSGVLDRVFLAERIGKGLAQVRIAGSALADLTGTELRGLPLSCLFAPESRPVLAAALEEVFAGASVVEIDLGADRGRPGLAIAQLLLLPLADEGDCRQLLGVIGLADGIGTCKLQVLARRSERLTPVRAVASGTRVAGPDDNPAGRYGHLRLVASEAQ